MVSDDVREFSFLKLEVFYVLTFSDSFSHFLCCFPTDSLNVLELQCTGGSLDRQTQLEFLYDNIIVIMKFPLNG